MSPRCLFCSSEEEPQDHHVAPGVLGLTVPLCSRHCHTVQTDRQYRAGVLPNCDSEAWSFFTGFAGLLIEQARASGAHELVKQGECLQRQMFRLLSALDERRLGPVSLNNALRKRRAARVSLTEEDALRAARAILDLVREGAAEWLGECPPIRDLVPGEDLAPALTDLTELTGELARAQLTGQKPPAVPDSILQLTDRAGINYLAASVHVYDHSDYDRAIRYVQRRHGSIAPARGMYTDTPDWLRRWPEVIERIRRVYFILDPDDGTIGRGVHRELTDCAARGITTYLVHFGESGAVATEDFELQVIDSDNWRRFATAVSTGDTHGESNLPTERTD